MCAYVSPLYPKVVLQAILPAACCINRPLMQTWSLAHTYQNLSTTCLRMLHLQANPWNSWSVQILFGILSLGERSALQCLFKPDLAGFLLSGDSANVLIRNTRYTRVFKIKSHIDNVFLWGNITVAITITAAGYLSQPDWIFKNILSQKTYGLEYFRLFVCVYCTFMLDQMIW